MVVASLEGVKQAVIAGLGVALVPAFAAAGDLSRGTLAAVAIDVMLPRVEWGVITAPAASDASPTVDQLLRALKEAALVRPA